LCIAIVNPLKNLLEDGDTCLLPLFQMIALLSSINYPKYVISV